MIFKDARKNQDGIPEISVQELQAKLKEEPGSIQLVDVRRPDEYTGELGHVDGTSLSTLETEFRDAVDGWDKSKPVVFICRSGKRSSTAAGVAKESGYSEVYNLAGGMVAWNQEGLPTKK